MVLQTIPGVGSSVERIATQLGRIEAALTALDERLRAHESAITAIVIQNQQADTSVYELASYVIAFVNFMIELEQFEVPALTVLRDCAAGSPNWIIFAAALWYNMRVFIAEYYNIDITDPDEIGEDTTNAGAALRAAESPTLATRAIEVQVDKREARLDRIRNLSTQLAVRT